MRNFQTDPTPCVACVKYPAEPLLKPFVKVMARTCNCAEFTLAMFMGKTMMNHEVFADTDSLFSEKTTYYSYHFISIISMFIEIGLFSDKSSYLQIIVQL